MTSPPRPGRHTRPLSVVWALVVAVLTAVGLLTLASVTASAATLPDPGNRVGAFTPETILPVGVSEHVSPGQGRGPPVSQAGIVVVTGVAAESLTPLEQGVAKVPADWGPGLANRDLGGTRWFDPADPGNGIRIDKAVPDSPFPSQQVDHVIVRSGGRVIGPDGKPIVGSIKQNPDAHIPLSDWLNWTSWNTP